MFFKLIRSLVVLAFVVSMTFSPAFAFEQGHWKLEPGFKSLGKWDSNIFYDNTNEKSDFITVLTPSILGELGFGDEGKHKVGLDYKVDLGIFAEYHDQNYGNHDTNQRVFLDFEDYSLEVKNNFKFTSSRAGTEFENRNLRKEDTFDAILGWHFNKLDFETGYRFFIVDYLSDTLRAINRRENSGWVAGYMEIAPKTKALLEFMYTNLDYPDTGGRDGNAYRIMTGVKGEITPKLSGIAKAGYKFKKYTSSTNDDFSSAVAHIDLMYAFSDRVDLIGTYNREAFESTYTSNNYYTGDHFTGAVNYRFGQGFTAKVDGMYYYNQYPELATGQTEKRTDHEWASGLGLDYQMKEWLTMGAGYNFHRRDSNIGSRTYDQHVISMYSAVKF